MSVSPSTVPGDQYLGGLFMFLCRAIRAHLFLTVLLPLVAMAIAYVAALQLPTVYMAQGSIRIGKVDGADSTNLLAVVSRINSPSFKRRVVQTMNVPVAEGSRPAQLIFGSLTAKQESPDTVAVGVRATTAQQARDVVVVTVGLLNEEQSSIRDPLEADVKQRLANSDATIAGLLAIKESLSRLTREDPPSDPASSALQRLWLSDLISRNEQRLAAERAERHALAAKLSAWRTYSTALVDDAFVLSGFAFARPVTIALLAGGVVFGVFLLIVILRTSKTSSVQ
jgi:hypothetical protein